ncbi:small ribosomal subunit protein uS2-like [Sycon ciliatum]|uniref:small ribosomal subunit protein uS2-like n=1 Tax=Sycon ciliatum TaxID=27933 RepID=UPI0031F6BB6A
MSGGQDILKLSESDVSKMLAAGVHLGAKNCDFQMNQYVFKKKTDGTNIINLKNTWEKLLLAARVIVGIENPADVSVITGKSYAQRAVLKFSHFTGSNSVAGRFTPGAFTNQIQKAFKEPRLLVVSDPRVDHQAVTESSYVGTPVIAFCNTDTSLRHIDIAIPCNNKGVHSIGLMWWMLAREVLRMRGTISRELPWEATVMPDLFFYRDPEEVEKEEQAAREAQKTAAAVTTSSTDDWGAVDPAPAAAATTAAAPAPAATSAAPAPADDWGATGAGSDWGNTTTTTDWAAETS